MLRCVARKTRIFFWCDFFCHKANVVKFGLHQILIQAFVWRRKRLMNSKKFNTHIGQCFFEGGEIIFIK